MRSKKLVLMMAAPACMALCSMGFAAQKVATAPKPAAAKPAVTAAKKFNQEAELKKFWNGPDSAVVGTVDGLSVTKGELVKALWARTAPSMLSELLDQKMIEAAAKKAKVSVSDADVKAQIKETLARMNMTEEQLETQYKVTHERFIATLRMQAAMKKLSMAKSSVASTEYASYMKARHILVLFAPDIADKAQQEAAAKVKIDAIAARLKAGEDFATVAKEVSEDKGSKDSGGELGWFSKGRMVPEFETAAFELKAGQTSEPVKSPYGYHIIKAEAMGKDATGADRAELKKIIVDSKAPQAMQTMFGDIKSASKRVDKISFPEVKMAMPAQSAPPKTQRPIAVPAPAPAAPKATPAVQVPPAPSDRPDAPPPPPAN